MTPIEIVNHMIDDVLNLTKEQLNTFLFLEPSCGNGAFVKTLILRGVPANHIYACDIDEEISREVKKLLPEKNFRIGSFFQQNDWINKFDVVIGNPPFVRIHNIQEQVKNEIVDFAFCKGMYDLYYAFYERGLSALKPNGVLLYISPNSFVKNASGFAMRKYIADNHLLKYYEDFADNQQFDGYSTYTSIVKLSTIGEECALPWINERQKVGLNFTSVQNGIATLADKIFIQDDFSYLEPDIIRPIIKASTGEMKYCIIPPKTEEELKNTPKAYEYLLAHKEALLKRALTAGTEWFQFGRAQGLKNMWQDKIAISSILSPTGLKIIRVNKECLVYSGLYVTSNDLDKLEQQLKNEDLLIYLLENGKPMRGGYVQITSKLLNEY